MRSIALVAALLLPQMASAVSASNAERSDPKNNPIFSRIEGKWDIISNPKHCSEGTDVHVIRFNKERTVAYFERPNPPKNEAGNPVSNYSYTVIYSNDQSITMHLVGEQRKLRTGDDYIWVIQEKELGTYAWRLYGFPLRDPEPTTFKKCPR